MDRAPPRDGGGLTPSAHDMNREWAVTSALADTNVPAAPTVAIDRDGEIIGAPAPVVEFVDGLVIRSTDDLNIWSDDEVTANFDALVRLWPTCTPSTTKRSDWVTSVGLRASPADRSLWARQWGLVKTRDLADVDTLVAKPSERIPTDARSTIVHGDFRVDNTIIDGEILQRQGGS